MLLALPKLAFIHGSIPIQTHAIAIDESILEGPFISVSSRIGQLSFSRELVQMEASDIFEVPLLEVVSVTLLDSLFELALKHASVSPFLFT